jgi:hypothetical protein
MIGGIDYEVKYTVTKKELRVIRENCYHPEYNGDCRSNNCEYYNSMAHACGFGSLKYIEDVIYKRENERKKVLSDLREVFLHTKESAPEFDGAMATKITWSRQELLALLDVFSRNEEYEIIPKKPVYPPEKYMKAQEYFDHI